MLQSADGLGHLQKILMSIVISLVVISLVLCITMLIYLMVYGKESLKEALTFVVVVLVVSIPIAIEIVCTTTLAIGSRQVRQCNECGLLLMGRGGLFGRSSSSNGREVCREHTHEMLRLGQAC
jgi:cation transport ATPase